VFWIASSFLPFLFLIFNLALHSKNGNCNHLWQNFNNSLMLPMADKELPDCH
jgi:hypothetical protein